MWCIPALSSGFVAKMEDVLEVYEKPLNPKEPVVCLDEKPVSLHQDIRPVEYPRKSGEVLKRDYEYVRAGTANVFCGIEPKTGKKFTKATPNRTGLECAHMVKEIVEAYPEAVRIHLVWDNLNTHRVKPLVDAFGTETGYRIWEKVQVHYTPEHGSWLNQAEAAISAFAQQCLGQRRMGTWEALNRETSIWNLKANQNPAPTRWAFTVAKARKKFKYQRLNSGVS